MSKLFIRLWFIFLLPIVFVLVPRFDYVHSDPGYSREEVHGWPGSRCTICHISSDPDEENAALIMADRSRLCETCHKGTVTILPIQRLKSRIEKMDNHPIKFSPLVFDPEKINHNIVKEEGYFNVLRQTRKVPLFGRNRETAVAECTTCHDPHGKLDLTKLQRLDNTNGELCLVCHLTI
jgi:predicted CXXCH cytochrome family protein